MPAFKRTTRSSPKYCHYKPKDLVVVRIDGRYHYFGKYDSPENWEKSHRILAGRHARGGVSPVSVGPDDVGPTDSELIREHW